MFKSASPQLANSQQTIGLARYCRLKGRLTVLVPVWLPPTVRTVRTIGGQRFWPPTNAESFVAINHSGSDDQPEDRTTVIAITTVLPFVS